MPKPTKGPRLGGSPAHQRIILNNLASQLFEHGRITTTETKAKRVQPLAETLITKAKRGDLHNRRLVLRKITNKSVVHILFTEIAPRMADRDGGYTRITKIGNRQGDNAPMAVIEIVTETVEESRQAKAKAKPARASEKVPARKAAPKKAAKAEFATLEDRPADSDVDEAADEASFATLADRPAEGDAAVDEAATDEDARVAGLQQKYGEAAFIGENPPATHAIKGNEDSMKFHTPASPWYGRTIAEVWFATEADAEAAGFVNAVSDGEEA